MYRYQYVPSLKLDHNFHDNSKLSIYVTAFRTHHLTGTGGGASGFLDALPTPITTTREMHIKTVTVRVNYDKRALSRPSCCTWASATWSKPIPTAR